MLTLHSILMMGVHRWVDLDRLIQSWATEFDPGLAYDPDTDAGSPQSTLAMVEVFANATDNYDIINFEVIVGQMGIEGAAEMQFRAKELEALVYEFTNQYYLG